MGVLHKLPQGLCAKLNFFLQRGETLQSRFESNGTALHAIIMVRDTPRINLSPPESDIRRASASAVAALSLNLSSGAMMEELRRVIETLSAQRTALVNVQVVGSTLSARANSL